MSLGCNLNWFYLTFVLEKPVVLHTNVNSDLISHSGCWNYISFNNMSASFFPFSPVSWAFWGSASFWGRFASHGWASTHCSQPLHDGKCSFAFFNMHSLFRGGLWMYVCSVSKEERKRFVQEQLMTYNFQIINGPFWIHTKSCFIRKEGRERRSLSHILSSVWCVMLVHLRNLLFAFSAPPNQGLLWNLKSSHFQCDKIKRAMYFGNVEFDMTPIKPQRPSFFIHIKWSSSISQIF